MTRFATRIPSLAVQREAARSNTRVMTAWMLGDARDALDDGNIELLRAHLEQLHRDALAVLDGEECAVVAKLRGRVALACDAVGGLLLAAMVATAVL